MILITGGAGYIGSHTCLELLQAGHELVVIDNLSNSSVEALHRVQTLTGKKIQFIQCDIRDAALLNTVFNYPIAAVIHFAGLKSINESIAKPLEYYENNVQGTLTLLQIMKRHNVHNIVFSSSATVYGIPQIVPIKEDFPLSVTNPYGNTKLIIEEILRDLSIADPAWNIALLRYFNPVGAHESGQIGEDPNGTPNNLMPYITQVALGKLPVLRVFGNDYSTPDGTGVRDFIHVVDLAKGHTKALEALKTHHGLVTVNLGTGRGYSVLELISTFEKVTGQSIPYEIVERRPGDVASCYADTTKAETLLNWKAEKTLEDMCASSWAWQKANPDGYPDSVQK